MGRLKHIALILAAVMLTATGCIRRDAVRLYDVSDIDIKMSTSPRISAVLDVENSSCRKITVSDAVCILTDADGNVIGKAVTEETLTLPKHSRTALYVPVRISLDNPLKWLAVLADLDGNYGDMKVSATATLKTGCIKKKIRLTDIPLATLIDYISLMDKSGKTVPATHI